MHQKILCNENCRLPIKTIKEFAVRIETLVQKACCLNTHDCENTKLTKILKITLLPQLKKAMKIEQHIYHQFANQTEISANMYTKKNKEISQGN